MHLIKPQWLTHPGTSGSAHDQACSRYRARNIADNTDLYRRPQRFRSIQLPRLARWFASRNGRRRYFHPPTHLELMRCATTQHNADAYLTDGYVRIWSTEAILNSASAEYTKPKQLAAVSHHSGTIHAVRFSSNGKYLASGADDKIVCVYALDPNAPTHAAFGGYCTR